MAYEKTEPRNNQILLWGVVSILTLFALVPLFHSYFGITFGDEFAAKVYEVPNTPYQELRDGQRAELRTSPISVDQAIQQLAARGRSNTPVMPRPNDAPNLSEEDYEASLAPVTGWAQLPRERAAEAARRAMRSRRQQLEAEAGIPAPEAAEGAAPAEPDSPTADTIRPPAELVRPTAMIARPTPMVQAPAP